MDIMTHVDPQQLDRRAARRAFSKAGATYDQVAVLQSQVRELLLERLELLKLQPKVVLDLGCGTALASQQLQDRYPAAQVIAMDAAIGMLRQAGQHKNLMQRLFKRGFQCVCADAFQLPLRSASVDMVFSNLMLQWCDPPDAVFAEIRRVLKPDGVLLFSSFGPDTLNELRRSWAQVDNTPHVNRFIDMHDLGDAMMRAGLSEPVLDVDRYTLLYDDVMTLMRELKAIGAHNVNAGRTRGLTGRKTWQRLRDSYELLRRDDGLPASYEVVCGQAWGNTHAPSQPGEIRIPIAHIKHRSSLRR
jgi:malonyl-CoA O-methyltransferase